MSTFFVMCMIEIINYTSPTLPICCQVEMIIPGKLDNITASRFPILIPASKALIERKSSIFILNHDDLSPSPFIDQP